MTHADYDLLERAIAAGRRVTVSRRGTEYTVIPIALRSAGRHEFLDAVHPTTGEALTLLLDELSGIEAIR